MQGDRTVVLWVSAVNVAAGDVEMAAKLDRHGLEKLLDAYGVGLGRDVVLDGVNAVQLPVRTSSGLVRITVPGISVAKYDADAPAEELGLENTFPVFFRLETLALPYASTLTLHPENQPRASLRAVARSSAQATASTDDGLLLKPTAEPVAGDAPEQSLGFEQAAAAL